MNAAGPVRRQAVCGAHAAELRRRAWLLSKGDLAGWGGCGTGRHSRAISPSMLRARLGYVVPYRTISSADASPEAPVYMPTGLEHTFDLPAFNTNICEHVIVQCQQIPTVPPMDRSNTEPVDCRDCTLKNLGQIWPRGSRANWHEMSEGMLCHLPSPGS
jgi:hypothetical protein